MIWAWGCNWAVGFDYRLRAMLFWDFGGMGCRGGQALCVPCSATAFALGLYDVTAWLSSLLNNGPWDTVLLQGTGTALLGWGLALEALWYHGLCQSGSSASAFSIAGSCGTHSMLTGVVGLPRVLGGPIVVDLPGRRHVGPNQG